MAESLLPPNTTPFLRALSEALADASSGPGGDLGALWDPRRCPPAALPVLARALGVELWSTQWPLGKQRKVVAAAVRLARRRGTFSAFAEMLATAGAQLVTLDAPPARACVRRPLTDAERLAWAAQFPLLRITRLRKAQRRPNALVAGRCWGGRRRAPRASTAQRRLRLVAHLDRKGQSRPVALSGRLDGVLRAALPASGRRLVAGRGFLGRAPVASSAAARVYTFALAERRSVAAPPARPSAEVSPGRVYRRHSRERIFVAGRPLSARRPPKVSAAGDHVAVHVRLIDPELARSGGLKRRGGVFAGRARLGQAPFHLRLNIDAKRVRPGRRAFPFSPGGVLRAHDRRPMQLVGAAVRAASLGRDRVTVRTNLYRTITAGDGVPLDGSFRLDQIVRSL